MANIAWTKSRIFSLTMHLRHGLILLLMCGMLALPSQGNLTVTEDHEEESLCQKWASNETLRQIIREGQQKASPCPCHRLEAELEHTYEQKDSCFTEYFYTDGVKQRCCYDTAGNLLLNKPGAGYLLVETPSTEISDAYQNCCRGDKETCHLFYDVIPSNDCSGYITPQYMSSGGDVHITTIDGVEYDFNGHGEYVFLKLNEESLEIQIRTDYLPPGNKDSTIITAVAIKVNQTMFNILLNRTSRVAALFLNSTYSILSSEQKSAIQIRPFLIFPSSENTFHIAYQSKMGSLKINIKAGEQLDITLIISPRSQIAKQTAIGLAGSTINGTLVSQNGTKYSDNASEHDFFDFGESWSLQYENESAFNYNLTNGNFSVYNTHHTKPKFLEDLVGNLTALFENSTVEQIDKYNRTCDENKECLLAIARSGDMHQGELIMDRIHKEQLRKEIAENTPPFFLTNWTRRLNISFENTKQFVLDLKALVGDKQDKVDQLTFTLVTTINNTDFYLKNGVFNWTHVSPSLRYSDVEITFIVQDHLNRTNTTDVSILYCGCETESQCNYGDVALTGDRFQRVSCSCNDKRLGGQYCEIHIPPCNNTQCFENVTCDNNAKNKDNPCGPCPSGYSGDGQSCDDINECNLDYCEQSCNNSKGSYSCSCWRGFTLSDDKHNCADIDECGLRLDNCSSYTNTRCRNTPGSFACECKPKYHKSTSGNCEAGGFSYVAELKIDISTTIQHQGLRQNYTLNRTETETVKTQISGLFLDTNGVVSIEIISARVIIVNSRTRKRDIERKLVIEFLAVTNNQTSTDNLTHSLQNMLDNINKTSKIWDIPVTSLKLNHAVAALPENQNRLCDVTSNTCDKSTTECKQVNGSTFCDCKPGFAAIEYGLDYCNDVNECLNASYLATNTPDDRCFQGHCQNIPGSWRCDCPTDKTWKQTGDSFYRCLDDYQYIGNLSFQLLDSYNESRVLAAVANELIDLFNTSKINMTKRLTVEQVFLKAEILDVQPSFYNILNISVTFVSIKYIVHIGTSVSWETFASVQSKSFKAWNWKIPGENFTGYIYDETVFSVCDIPERTDCQVSTSMCNVTNGSYHCDCKEGFKKTELMENEKYCIDVDECSLLNCSSGNGCCSGHGRCRNMVGNWTCDCDPGYHSVYNSYNNITCEDIDECEQNETYICQHGQCVNGIGNWTCSCGSGYKPRRVSNSVYICEDLDECSSDSYKCENGTCENLPGSWNCVCPQGYKNNSILESGGTEVVRCGNVNECDFDAYGYPACLEATKCVDSLGSWECLCESGQISKQLNSSTKICGGDYQYARNLEFTLVQTSPNVTILKTEIQAMLMKLYVDGLNGQSPHVYLEIINIELIGNNRDKRDASSSIPRDYRVTYVVHTNVKLPEDKIDKVMEDRMKSKNDSCQENNLGTYSINIRNEPTKFSHIKSLCDISSKNYCEVQSTNCTDMNNTIECTCKVGYKTDPFSHTRCQDVDECKQPSKYRCHGNTTGDSNSCSNLRGDWTCSCQKGFDPKRIDQYNVTCVDTDECNDVRYECRGSPLNPGAAVCDNTAGSWSCSCKDGYTKTNVATNKYVCEDMNECSDTSEKYKCQTAKPSEKNGAICNNTDGSWSCACAPGFVRQTYIPGRHYVCKDVCDDSPCQNDGNCIHKGNEDNYTCVCTAGWSGKHCDLKETDPEASHLKTILIACGASAVALIVLLVIAIFGVWRFRHSSSKEPEERLYMNTFGAQNSWPFKNGNVYTSTSDRESVHSSRNSGRLSIPRAQLGKSTSEETAELRNPAPDYDLHFPQGVNNPAPDYGPDDSPVTRRQHHGPESRARSGSFGRPSNKYNYDRSRDRKSTPTGLTNAYSYL